MKLKRVLIVSPNFPPIACPDMHRVRMSLPFLAQFGWEALILKINPNEQEGSQDEALARTIAADAQIWQAGCVPRAWTRWLGINSVGLRSFLHLAHAGDRIIQTFAPQLVFFSTTMFALMTLGRYWHSKFGTPYVLDFQDPWLSSYYAASPSQTPPGGRLKYHLAQGIAKYLEAFTLRQVSHIISVSPAYPNTLQQRYPHLQPAQFTVLPFGAPAADFEQLPALNVRQTIFDPQDGDRHWVYVGRGGHDMALALRSLFQGIQAERHRDPAAWRSIRLHFVGTSYAAGDRAIKTVEPIAQEMGVADLVTEYPQRIPYFEALQVLTDSDAILLIGSDDAGYTASKLYPCVLARKPILAVFHRHSSVVDILRQCQAGRAVTFTADSSPAALQPALAAQLRWLLSLPQGAQPETNWAAFQPYTAREMTRQQCAVFDRVLTCAQQNPP